MLCGKAATDEEFKGQSYQAVKICEAEDLLVFKTTMLRSGCLGGFVVVPAQICGNGSDSDLCQIHDPE